MQLVIFPLFRTGTHWQCAVCCDVNRQRYVATRVGWNCPQVGSCRVKGGANSEHLCIYVSALNLWQLVL